MTQPSDLRTYLADLEDQLLQVPKAVSLNHISGLINQVTRPVLFKNILGFQDWQLADMLLLSRRTQAIALKTEPENVLDALGDRLRGAPKKPAVVATGPCKEKIFLGGAASLKCIPCFQNGEEDMGPALMAMTISKDPASGNQNMSWTRMTPLSDQTAAYFIGSSTHMRSILSAHESRGEDMPMAFVMGVHPAYEIMGSYSVVDHLSRFGELDLVSSVLGEDIELVECETQPLHVPANCEVVIEGFVHGDGRRTDEGPGPSQALYYVPGVTPQPVFQVTAVTRRSKPIMRQINTLLYTDHQSLIGLPHEALLLEQLRRLDIRVHDVLYTPWSGTLACVIKVTPEYIGQVRDMLMLALAQRFPSIKLAIAIDDDIDIESAEDVLWSISTRADMVRDVISLPDMKGHPIDPSSRAAGGDPRRRLIGKMAIDATKPPLSQPNDRHTFRRTVPFNWGKAKIEDYL